MRALSSMVIVLIGLVPLAMSAAPASGASRVCHMTATSALKSCRIGARADHRLALAKCDNQPDTSSRRSCARAAATAENDALASCVDQHDVRAAACSRLGPGPYHANIDPANFTATVDNPFFPLVPGTIFVYEGQTPDGFEHDEFAITHTTRVIAGVACTEVHDTVTTDGVLTEDTLDWFAQDTAGNVWYFGENTHELVDGLISTIDGTFMAGVDDAQPGIVMEAHPAIGDFYRQEFDLDNAEDFADVVGLNASVTVPYGTFTNCLYTRETTPLEPDLHEHKYYAAGVGDVLETDEDTGARIELVQIKTGQ